MEVRRLVRDGGKEKSGEVIRLMEKSPAYLGH